MSDFLFTSVPLSVKHLPEYSAEIDGNGKVYQQELPGFIEVGIEVGGVFLVLHRRKAAGFLTDLQRAKDAASSGPTDAAAPAPPEE